MIPRLVAFNMWCIVLLLSFADVSAAQAAKQPCYVVNDWAPYMSNHKTFVNESHFGNSTMTHEAFLSAARRLPVIVGYISAESMLMRLGATNSKPFGASRL